MSKAILVLELPKSCSECSLCDLYDSNGAYCFPADTYPDQEDVEERRATFCPLVELPE